MDANYQAAMVIIMELQISRTLVSLPLSLSLSLSLYLTLSLSLSLSLPHSLSLSLSLENTKGNRKGIVSISTDFMFLLVAGRLLIKYTGYLLIDVG